MSKVKSIIVVLLMATLAVSGPAVFADGRARKSRQAALIREAEQLLSNFGYWTGRIDGVQDAGFRHALMAFQKVEGRNRTGRFNIAELTALRNASRPPPLDSGPFHIEVDLARQILFVVEDSGIVTRILPVSTGNGQWFTAEGWSRQGVTPTGRFRIFRKISGTRRSELGLLYYPNYIVGGIAIHGSTAMTPYPDSHGCIRIPLYASKEFFEMAPVGTPVIVHSGLTVE